MAETITMTADDVQRYLRQTSDFKPFVQPVGAFVDAMANAFETRHEPNPMAPTMFSTKLRDRLRFRPGEVTCWAGYNGHRKSMFLGQVCADIVTQRRPVLVMSMEMKPAATFGRMARQMLAKVVPKRDELERWGEATDRLFAFDYMGRIDPALCLAACSWWATATNGGAHIVIDSMMMVCASEEHLDEQKQFMTDLVRFASESSCHVHLVAHCRKPAAGGGEDRPPTKYDLRGSASISDQVHNVVTIWANKPKQRKIEANEHDEEVLAQPDALVTVEKQRNGEWEGRVKLWFHGGTMRFCDDSRLMGIEPYPLQGAP